MFILNIYANALVMVMFVMGPTIFQGLSSDAMKVEDYYKSVTKVQSPSMPTRKKNDMLFDVYKKKPQTKHKRSTWDGCSLKLYTRQYYQGKEVKFNESHRRVSNRHYPKSIKTFGKCCWRIFWHGRRTRAHFLQGNSEYPSQNLFPVLRRVGSVVLNPKWGGICN